MKIKYWAIIMMAGGIIQCQAADKSGNQITPEQEAVQIARENNLETAKNYCIQHWTTKPGNVEALSKFASVSEQCGCVMEEMKFLVSSDLSLRLFKMQIHVRDSTAFPELTEKEMNSTAKEWADLHTIANKSCGERFIRRHQLAR